MLRLRYFQQRLITSLGVVLLAYALHFVWQGFGYLGIR